MPRPRQQGGGRPPGGQNPNPNQGGGGNRAPKHDLQLFPSGTRKDLRLRVEFKENGNTSAEVFKVALGNDQDPMLGYLPIPGTNPQQFYNITTDAQGNGNLLGVDVTPFPHCTKVTLVGTTINVRVTKDLPTAEPSAPAVGGVAPAPTPVSEPDNFFVAAYPVLGSATEWKIDGKVTAKGKPMPKLVIHVNHMNVGVDPASGDPILTPVADMVTTPSGTFGTTIVTDKDAHIPVSIEQHPEFSIQTEAVLADPVHADTTHAPMTAKHKISLVLFFLGLWITFRTAQDFGQKIFSPQLQGSVSVAGAANTAEQRRNERLSRKPGEKPRVETPKPSFGQEAFVTIIPFAGDHDRSGLSRMVFCILYWVFYFFACFFLHSEDAKKGITQIKAKLHREHKGFSAKHERREYRLVLAKTTADAPVATLQLYVNNKLVEAASAETPAKKASGVSQWVDFAKRDAIFDFVFHHILPSIFHGVPFLKNIFRRG